MFPAQTAPGKTSKTRLVFVKPAALMTVTSRMRVGGLPVHPNSLQSKQMVTYLIKVKNQRAVVLEFKEEEEEERRYFPPVVQNTFGSG